jgi:hypothetical protein
VISLVLGWLSVFLRSDDEMSFMCFDMYFIVYMEEPLYNLQAICMVVISECVT